MRVIMVALVLLLGLPLTAHAACSGTISGKSKAAQLDISDGDCSYDNDYITYTRLGPDGNPVAGIEGRAPFDEECKQTLDSIVCRPNGRTPLSGASYKLETSGKDPCDETGNTVGTRYRCVKGCSGDAPQFLEIMPYEC